MSIFEKIVMYLKKTNIFVLFVLFFCEQLKHNNAESPYDQEKEVGESVTLKCSLTDLYNGDVSWKKIDGVMNQNNSNSMSFKII